MPPIISVVGKSGSGKTTLIEKLIPVLKNRGYRIGTLKHAFHNLEMDKDGKDSWRHKQAGAETVVVSSPGTVMMVKNSHEESLEDLYHYFQDVDLLITEGFKNENKPRIEIFRQANHDTPLSNEKHDLIALVTDADVDLKVPTFGLEDITPLAELIVKKFL